jgi:phosphatidylserine/phosphatidylglycerophosphate/cardiolipin synthase-like enzyme
MLRFVNRQIAADYTREFEQMFAGCFGRSKRSATPYPEVRLGAAHVEVYFAPEDGVAKHVLKRLAAAKRSIHFMTFSYTEDKISDAMIAKAKAGLQVRGVFESQNAGGTGADFNRLRLGRIDVLEDGNCYILHHKVIVIDERTVITGSYNFTSSAEKDNDENLVIVDNPPLARACLDELSAYTSRRNRRCAAGEWLAIPLMPCARVYNSSHRRPYVAQASLWPTDTRKGQR